MPAVSAERAALRRAARSSRCPRTDADDGSRSERTDEHIDRRATPSHADAPASPNARAADRDRDSNSLARDSDYTADPHDTASGRDRATSDRDRGADGETISQPTHGTCQKPPARSGAIGPALRADRATRQ